MKISAKWICSPKDSGAAAYTFQKKFAVSKEIESAILNVSSMGIYVPYINGERAGKNVLAPGWTSYHHRIQYQSYDITSLILKENIASFGLGQGWAVGFFGFLGSENHIYADHTSLIAWIDITYADGDKETIITDESWDVYTSEVTFSEIYHGETVDKTAPVNFVGC